jgi:hypothetical protein
MFTLYNGHYPAIACPDTGEVVVVFNSTAAGFSKCIELLRDVQAEISKERRHGA